MTISATPTFPPMGSATFNADAYAWATHMAGTFTTQANTLEANVNAKEASAAGSASTATNQASAAAASALLAGATLWVSGTTYAIGDARYSPINYQTYRRRTAGAGTTDPSADPTNWSPTAIATNIPQNSQSANYTLVLTDAASHIYHPSADTSARTFTIPANASVAFPIGTALTFVNDTSAGVVTIAINSDTMIMAGSGSTGSRTLAASSIATAMKITATRWIIAGTGLT